MVVNGVQELMIVNDVDKLPYYGFTKQPWKSNQGRDVWYKTVRTIGCNDEHQLELIVNPNDADAENEMICNISVYHANDGKDFELETQYPMETVLRMVLDGVVRVKMIWG